MCDVNISLLQNYRAQNRPWEAWDGASAHSRASCGKGLLCSPHHYLYGSLHFPSTQQHWRFLQMSWQKYSLPISTSEHTNQF